jgi:hypothetical protein
MIDMSTKRPLILSGLFITKRFEKYPDYFVGAGLGRSELASIFGTCVAPSSALK